MMRFTVWFFAPTSGKIKGESDVFSEREHQPWWRRIMAEYLVLIVTKLLALTLPWPTLYWLAIRLAGLNYRFSRSNKMGIRSNLRVILGERATEEEIDKV
jgi:lauroyl/myristoyl acyltransferase